MVCVQRERGREREEGREGGGERREGGRGGREGGREGGRTKILSVKVLTLIFAIFVHVSHTLNTAR